MHFRGADLVSKACKKNKTPIIQATTKEIDCG
jgi:hypothetical protein